MAGDMLTQDDIVAIWSAQDATEESDRITGTARTEANAALLAKAIRASAAMRPHPLDRWIGDVREKAAELLTPLPGQWWRDTDKEREAVMWRGVLAALLCVRLGDRPAVAANLMREHLAGETHMRDEAEMKVYHYCRLAGLMEAR